MVIEFIYEFLILIKKVQTFFTSFAINSNWLLYWVIVPVTLMLVLKVMLLSLKMITGMVAEFCFNVMINKPGVSWIFCIAPWMAMSLSSSFWLISWIRTSGGWVDFEMK